MASTDFSQAAQGAVTSMAEKKDVITVEDTAQYDLEELPQKAKQVFNIDGFNVLGLDPEDADFYNNFSHADRQRTKHKVDVRLVPMLAALYLVAHLDRSNIGNTKIEGIDDDLGINGWQWNLLLSLFFVPYVLLEVPSNIILKKFDRPSIHMGILATGWGVMMTLHGVVNNYAGILVLRILLGVFEAGFFPGAVYLTSFWYMPRDLAARISWFYCFSALSGAFSGLLAAGIAQMDGVGGYEGWRWIFILEGLVSVILGILVFFVLVDTPARGHKWLSPDEIRFLELQRFVKQGGRFQDETKEKKFIWRDLKACFLDWRLWLLTWTQFAQSAMAYGTKFNLPTLTSAMGYQNWSAQLMSAPPYVAGAIATIVLAKLSDKTYWRMPFVVGPFSLCVIGFAVMLGLQGKFADSVGGAYFAIVLACMGIYPSAPALIAWVGNNQAPASRRAIAVGLNICIGNAGGIMGSYMFYDSDAPAYNTGFSLSLAFCVTGLLTAVAAELSYKWTNHKRDQVPEEETRAKYTHDQIVELGPKSPLYRFTL
ncbi:MFS general substrate transporter [Hortaea werneckii]|nr:MFS general substrate transporter [Hortaea werneckii]KAI7303499.1 MFS general substrate transporter [Hortaea werneckii]KAI7390746.1 MFS general substrate transporter [Hortaea werneckii]